MDVIATKISDVLLFKPKVFGDERGFFMETWNQKRFEELVTGKPTQFVQDNHSKSKKGIKVRFRQTDIQSNHLINQPLSDDLLIDISLHTSQGKGSPQRLKHGLTGLWSRKIVLEHRLVYQLKHAQIKVYQCRYHY